MRPVLLVAALSVLGTVAAAPGRTDVVAAPAGTPRPVPEAMPKAVPAPVPEPTPAGEQATRTPRGAPTSIKGPEAPRSPWPARGNPVLCGCAASRLLGRGPAVVTADGGLAAWLHSGARLQAFVRDAAGALQPSTLPFAVRREPAFVRAEGAPTTDDALVVVQATGDGAGFVGVVRPRETAPRDVFAVTLRAAPDGRRDPAPVLDALWLAAPERRERRDCGTWTTMRTAFQTKEGSVAVEAFRVRDVRTGESRLVDARHVGAFGLGEVPTCRHGFPLSPGPQTLEVVPIGATGAAGEPWVLQHDGAGLVDVVRVATPASADPALVAAPLPVPGRPARTFSWLSVGGMWILSAVLACVCGVIGFLLWRFKRRRLQEVRCTACGAGIPLDVLDERTDGFFCPACGTAGLWKGRRRVDVDVTPL